MKQRPESCLECPYFDPDKADIDNPKRPCFGFCNAKNHYIWTLERNCATKKFPMTQEEAEKLETVNLKMIEPKVSSGQKVNNAMNYDKYKKSLRRKIRGIR